MAVWPGLTPWLAVVAGAVLAPGLLGAGILGRLRQRTSVPEWLAWSYVVGQLALAPVTFAWVAAGRPVPGPALPLAAAAVGIARLVATRARPGPQSAAAASASRPSRWPALVLVVVLAAMLDACTHANARPLLGGDDASIFAAKARLMWTAPGFDLEFGLHNFVRQPGRPMLAPLTMLLAYAAADRLLWFEARVPMQAFAFALVLLLYGALRRHTSPPVAAVVTLALAGTGLVQWGATAYADLTTGLALLGVVTAFARWRLTGDVAFWRLCCAAMTLGALAKEDWLGHLAVLGAVVAAGRLLPVGAGLRAGGAALPAREWSWLLLPAAAVAAKVWFNARWGVGSWDVHAVAWTGDVLAALPGRVARSLVWFLRELATPTTGGLLVPVLVVLAVGRWRERDLAFARQVALTVVGVVAVFVVVTAASRLELQWQLDLSADRLLLQVLPTAAFGVGLLLTARPRG